MIDFSQLAPTLNKDIMPDVQIQVYDKAPLWQLYGGFKADKDAAGDIIGFSEARVNPMQVSFKNDTMYVTIATGRVANTSIKVGGSFGYGQVPTSQGSLQIATPVAAFLVPKQVMKMKDTGAIVSAITLNMDGSVNSLAMDLNRQAYSDGTATLAYCNGSGTTSKTINVQPKATGVVGTNWNGDIPFAERYFPIGTLVKIGSNAATYVTGQTGDNIITVADNQTFAAGDAIVKQQGQSVATAETASEMTGLAGIFSTGAYMNIDPATVPVWKSIVDNNSGTPRIYSKNMLNRPYSRGNVKGKIKWILTNISNYNSFGESLTDQLKATKDNVLEGGWSGLQFMNGQANLILDPDCPDDKFEMVSPDYLFRGEEQGLEFEPGSLMQGQRLPNTLNYEVTCDMIGNIGTDLRAAHVLVDNVVGHS